LTGQLTIVSIGNLEKPGEGVKPELTTASLEKKHG
jgi:hypothetical protein